MKKHFFVLSLCFACLSLIVATEVLAAVTIPDEVNQAVIRDIRSYASMGAHHDYNGCVDFKIFPLKFYTQSNKTKWNYIWFIDLTKGEYGESGRACGQTANVACYKQTFKMSLISKQPPRTPGDPWITSYYHCTYKMRTHGFINLFGIDELTLQQCVKAAS